MSETEKVQALADKYYNSAGAISCQFVIKFKKLTPEEQALVNETLATRGIPPYDLNAKKKRGGSALSRKVAAQASVPKTLGATEQGQEQVLIKALSELQIDKKILDRFLADLHAAEIHLTQQLCELRGVPYVPEVQDDPFERIYKPAHAHARRNREEIAASEQCGCFFCRATFNRKAIVEYVEDGLTAICPNCGIDAVIGDKAGYELTAEFLQSMFRHWFSVPIRLLATKNGTLDHEINEQQSPPPAERATDWQPDEDEPPRAQDRFLGEEDEVPAGIGANLMGSLPDDPEEDDED